MTQAQRVARRWAYVGIVVGGLASMAGNVASTVLSKSDVHLVLRVPWAVLWPLLTYIGIEVLTRTQWERGFAHWSARVVLVGPVSMVAALVSYLHIHHLMKLSGEVGLAQAVGPLAIDGTLFGCTVVLLITSRTTRDALHKGPQEMVLDPAVATEVAEALFRPAIPQAAWETHPVHQLPAPTHSMEPYGPHPLAPTLESPAPQRAPRAAKWDRELAKELILNSGLKDEEIGLKVGTSYKTIQRFRRELREAQATAVPA